MTWCSCQWLVGFVLPPQCRLATLLPRNLSRGKGGAFSRSDRQALTPVRPLSTSSAWRAKPSKGGSKGDTGSGPDWILSDTLTRKKSVFLARAAPVASEKEAKENVKHLVTTDKKASKANHNITAWRIRNDAGREVQNSNDDGESAAGGKVLTLMQMMDVWDVMVVVTRWFGGIKLGPERFRVINAAAKDALDKGGWNKPRKQESDGNDKGTKKKKKR